MKRNIKNATRSSLVIGRNNNMFICDCQYELYSLDLSNPMVSVVILLRGEHHDKLISE